MYSRSDVQLLPSTLLPNYLPSRQRSLPRCNCVNFFFTYAYIHDKLSIDIQFLVFHPDRPPPGLFPDTQLVALDTSVAEGSFPKYPDWSCLIAGDGVWNEDGIYSFSPMTAFETCFCARLNTRSANAATVHTPPIQTKPGSAANQKTKNQKVFLWTDRLHQLA